MSNDKNTLKPYDIEKKINSEINKVKSISDEEFNKYMEQGKMYFSTFNLSFDISEMEVSGGLIDNLTIGTGNITAWIIALTFASVGGLIAYQNIDKLKDSFTKLIKKAVSNRQGLGVIFVLLGMAIIGTQIFMDNAKNVNKKEVQIYLKRVVDTKTIAVSLVKEMMNIFSDEGASVMSMMKKFALSVMGMLDITFQSVKKVIELAKTNQITQFSLVISMIGMHLIFGNKDSKTVTGGKYVL